MRALMSQHSQRTQNGPSMASIIIGAALVIGAVSVAGWVISGSGLDGRHIVGYAGWMVLAIGMAAQTITQLADYLVIREKMCDQEAEAYEAAVLAGEKERARREALTGTWTGDGPGQALTVRADCGQLIVRGWLSEHWQQHDERIWARNVEGLTEIVRELERSGEMKPADDEGTKYMREVLRLGGWPLPSFEELERELA